QSRLCAHSIRTVSNETAEPTAPGRKWTGASDFTRTVIPYSNPGGCGSITCPCIRLAAALLFPHLTNPHGDRRAAPREHYKDRLFTRSYVARVHTATRRGHDYNSSHERNNATRCGQGAFLRGG